MHNLKPGDRVLYKHRNQDAIWYSSAEYTGTVSIIYDDSDDVIVLWDDGETEQHSAEDLEPA